VFLTVILDAYPRRVIGWALGRTLEELTLAAPAYGAGAGRGRAGPSADNLKDTIMPAYPAPFLRFDDNSVWPSRGERRYHIGT